MNEQQAVDWISQARFAPFHDAMGGEQQKAVELYEWHARLAGACFVTLHHFEVLVRNAIDAELGRFQPDLPLRDTWLMDFNILQPAGIKQVIVAVERLDHGKEPGRGRVVAGLSFGFWAGLFSKHYEEIWRHRLRNAFPGASVRKDMIEPMRLIQRFRNRTAHHDCLLNQPVIDRYSDMRMIARWIDPAAEAWLVSSSSIEDVLASKPTRP